jgi:trehalose synthase
MLQIVDVGERRLDTYNRVVPQSLLEALRAAAGELAGLRILHLSATTYGGGVSELLRSLVPLCNDLGLATEWKVIPGDDEFFRATKAIHNGLQGGSDGITESECDAYRVASERNAGLLEKEYDVVVVHDPQPAGLLPPHDKNDARWLWRCHIDTSSPNPEVWDFLRPWLADYDAAIFTMREFLPPEFPVARIEVIPPAIDPLSPKNLALGDEIAGQVLDWIGVELDRPLVTQISRFDPWKDPLGVIAAYRLARREVPGLQLALAGSMAHDDPEGWEIYREVEAASEADPLLHVFTNLTGVGNVEVNAFQRQSDVCIQKSIREGFGLVVSETLWKRTPMVAGRAGGIPLQMADGAGGVLVDSTEECASAIVDLLNDRPRADELARRGQDRVHDHFLLPRLILDELSLIGDIVGTSRVAATRRDPVCGISLTEPNAGPTKRVGSSELHFCSEYCLDRFDAAPPSDLATFTRRALPPDR